MENQRENNPFIVVKEIIEKITKTKIDDPRLNLFEAGLIDSLNAMRLLVEIERSLSISLGIKKFVNRDNFTVESISQLAVIALGRSS